MKIVYCIIRTDYAAVFKGVVEVSLNKAEMYSKARKLDAEDSRFYYSIVESPMSEGEL